MKKVENESIFLKVVLNNGLTVYGHSLVEDLEDALNGYYNDDKFFLQLKGENGKTLIYMKNVVMIEIRRKSREKQNEDKGKDEEI